MNIFRIDNNPFKAAQYHADHHVGKMLLEACQLLATAHPEPDVEGWRGMTPQLRLERDLLPYMHTHVNHPCAVWVRSAKVNYNWLVALADELVREYRYRFDKDHGARPVAGWLLLRHDEATSPYNVPPIAPPQAMPDAYKHPDPVEAYREYYAAEKRGFWRRGKWIAATWTRREVPWFMGVKS